MCDVSADFINEFMMKSTDNVKNKWDILVQNHVINTIIDKRLSAQVKLNTFQRLI